MIDANADAGPTNSGGPTGGVAPYDAAVGFSVEVIVKCVGAAAHDTLRMSSTSLAKDHRVLDTARTVHVDVSGAIQRGIAKHIITSEVHPGNVKGACIPLLGRQRSVNNRASYAQHYPVLSKLQGQRVYLI